MKVKDRALILRDGGKVVTLLPGQTVPKHLRDKVTNNSVTRDDDGELEEEFDAEDVEDVEEDVEDVEDEEDSDLEEMTVPQLTDLAKAEGADLTGISLKADIIAAIEAHRADND
jgi:CBS-domain-containing membrane protein